MRRSIGLVLVGLGVLMLVLAPMARWYAYPRLAVVSNDVAERVSTGSDITVLDLGAVVRQEAEIERVTDVRSVRRIIPDQGESTGDVAVWDTSVTNFDELGAGATPEENVLSYFEERVAFDRRSADAVDGHDQYYTPTGERADRVEVDHQGYYFKLPFGTEQRTYAFWDSTIQDTRPLRFRSETTLEGLPVYVFEQVIEPTPVSALEVPGALFGQTGSIVADRIYSNTRTLWVEPQTGAVIKGQEVQDSYLDFEGTRGPTIVQGTLAYTGDQVAANVDEFADSAERLELVRDTVPVAAAAGGAVLVILGLLLARRGSYSGKRRAPLPDEPGDDGVSGGYGGGPASAPAAAAPTLVTRPAQDRAPLQPRPRPRTEEPVGHAEAPSRVSPYDAPRYEEQRRPEPRRAEPRFQEPVAPVPYQVPESFQEPEPYSAQPYTPPAEPDVRAGQNASAERSQQTERAERPEPPAAAPEPQPEPAPESLPRRPQPSAVRPPVGRPHVQPPADQSQADAQAERNRVDLARLERARAELARFAQEHPDLAGTKPATAPAVREPSAPEPAAHEQAAGDDSESATPAQPAAPPQSGRRRAREDDGLFDEFDEDGQSAGSLHRY